MNPLFPEEPLEKDAQGYLLPRGDKRHIARPTGSSSPAVALIRNKIEALYAREPNARAEAAAAERVPSRSKHQEFMHRLTTSGRSMADIQTAWHEYYVDLPDAEKHEVWQEFYSANSRRRAESASAHAPELTSPDNKPIVAEHEPTEPHGHGERSAAHAKKQVLKRLRVSHSAQLKAKQHLQSLAFGLALGAITLLIFLFGLFNELVVTPFIRPGTAQATPIILNSNAPAPSSTPEVIIPKINAQLPVVYGGQSLAEADVQKALEDGVFHYPTTALPGQNGNVALFGHSSNNIFNKGRYKFAFVLLKELEPGDIFYLTHDGKVYTYKVYTKKIVNPEDTWVLGPAEGKTATAALITCDPPGTTRHRLVVWGEQISPDPGANAAQAEPSPALQTANLPGKGQSMWSKVVEWVNPFD